MEFLYLLELPLALFKQQHLQILVGPDHQLTVLNHLSQPHLIQLTVLDHLWLVNSIQSTVCDLYTPDPPNPPHTQLKLECLLLQPHLGHQSDHLLELQADWVNDLLCIHLFLVHTLILR